MPIAQTIGIIIVALKAKGKQRLNRKNKDRIRIKTTIVGERITKRGIG